MRYLIKIKFPFQHMPWGEPFVDRSTTGFAATYTYSGKERDAETGYSYFGARYYSSGLSVWLSIDPMAAKYPSLSPYTYCANNPMRVVDPDGNEIDEWEINKKGRIVKHIKTTKHDAFYMVDENGNRIDSKELTFKYGTIENYQSQYSDEAKTTFDWYSIRGDENGTQLFEFFANNTTVEFSQLMLGQKGDDGLNIISTSHEPRKEQSVLFLLENQYKFGYTIRGHNHNHPGNTPYPSGLDGKPGDVGFAHYLTNTSMKNGSGVPVFKIYLPKTRKYINYNRNSTIYDFPTAMPAYTLPEVIVSPRK